MKTLQAYGIIGTTFALIGMFGVKLLHPITGKYFTWAVGLSGYVESFVILFVLSLIAYFIIKRTVTS